MRTCRLMTILAGLLLIPISVHAQPNYPSRPIRLIVPFPPGGQLDIVARLLAPKLSESFKQSVVVDNRAGGGGSIGAEIALRAEADGHTLVIVSGAYAANAALYKLPFDPLIDMTPIALIGETSFVLTVHPSLAATSVKELIAYEKSNTGKLNYGSGGNGTSTHLSAELFNHMAGTRLTHVPYKGVGPALNDLLGGQIQIMFADLAPAIPYIKANRLRGIAVTTAKRSSAMPAIPALGESLTGYEAVSWSAALGPKGMPKDIVTRWNREINRIIQLPEFRERMLADGIEPAGGSPERLRDALHREIAKWRNVVKIAGIQAGT